MAREAIVWTPEMDNKLRRYARCGWSVRRQASKLGLSERSVYTRRKQIRLQAGKARKYE